MIKQRKSLSQSFLQTEEPCRRLVDTLPQEATLLEIGPGQGILTKCLLNRFPNIHTVEKDERFHALLLESLPQIHHQLDDVLNIDLAPYSIVCGNIPYHISSPILQKVIQSPQVIHASFLVQKEFAERLTAMPGTKNYGSLSVYTQLHMQASIDSYVGKELFFPMPKVDSAIVVLKRIRPAQYSPEIIRKAEILSRVGFHQRRKKLRNTWKAHLPNESTSIPIDLDLRPENLRVEDFIRMARFCLEHT